MHFEVSVPYSKAYSTVHSVGSFFGLRTGTKPAFSASAMAGAKK